MRKQMFRPICLGGLSAIAIMLGHQQPVLAADDVKTMEIILPGPVFAEPAVTISAGQSIKWVPKDADILHHLVQDMPDGTTKEITAEFESPETPTQKFEKPGVIKYHCIIHPRTMIGTITVK